ncbi:MAG: hypothetical protein COS85_08715 [Armatimonadetes bacterium CG07_land_8_20_14_0_80_59_28]|nr:MAG: hypothetical protein COS85_08715 [Armatimonadetes bacterium CG07_land_8_20_14_0_80_59_28]
MSRLPALTYAEVTVRLRAAGFFFDRQAKGSYEICTISTPVAGQHSRTTLETSRAAHYCIVLEVPPQKDAGSLQRPVAHTGSYTMEGTLLFSPFNSSRALGTS